MNKLGCGFIKPLQGARLVWMEIMFITLVSVGELGVFLSLSAGAKGALFLLAFAGTITGCFTLWVC